MDKYSDLIKRLEGGEGADRELDIAIAAATSQYWTEGFRRFLAVFPGRSLIDYLHHHGGVLPYTTSLDACLALQEAVLPDWYRSRTNQTPEASHYLMSNNKSENYQEVKAVHKSECRAWLIAILKALQP